MSNHIGITAMELYWKGQCEDLNRKIGEMHNTSVPIDSIPVEAIRAALEELEDTAEEYRNNMTLHGHVRDLKAWLKELEVGDE